MCYMRRHRPQKVSRIYENTKYNKNSILNQDNVGIWLEEKGLLGYGIRTVSTRHKNPTKKLLTEFTREETVRKGLKRGRND